MSRRVILRMLSVLALSVVGSASLMAQVTDDFPEVNPRDYYGNMSMSVKTVQNGQVVEDVTVAVYSGDEMRGKGQPTNAQKPGVVYLTVCGNRTGEELRFKVLTKGCLYEVVPDDLSFKLNGIVGSPKNPYEIDITDADKTVILLNEGDNLQTIEEHQRETANVLLQGRTLYKDGEWNTLCLPFDVTAEQLADPNHPFYGAIIRELDTEGFYKTNEKTGYDIGTGTLYLYFKATSVITAGVPCLIKWEKADGYEDADLATRDVTSPVIEDVTIDYGLEAQGRMTVTSEDGNVSFLGTYSPMHVEAGNPHLLFLGVGNTLYMQRTDKAGTHRSLRACFRLNDSPAAGVRRIVMNLDEEKTTGIEEVTDSTPSTLNSQSSEWWTLSGVKLEKMPTEKGVYICNGTKVMIK